MDKIKKTACLITCSLIFGLFPLAGTQAQGRISYQDLVNRQRDQHIYFDFFTLPGNRDSTVQFVSTFRMDYSFLPFRKTDDPGQEKQFYSNASLSLEIFKAEERKERGDRIRVEKLEPVTRTFWNGTAYAENYQQTKSNNTFLNGYVQVELAPGLYNYLLQLNRDEYAGSELSRVRQTEILPYGRQRQGTVIYAESTDNESSPSVLDLLDFGDNVYYGKDFYAFVHLPDYDSQSAYALKIHRVEIHEEDTTERSSVLEQPVSPEQVLTNIKPALKEQNENTSLTLDPLEDGYTYALLKIPNSRFPNAVYQIGIFKEGRRRPVAQSIFHSLWLDMPISLLNLDIAVNMLRFIVDRETLDNLREGSGAEREKKFRAFWKAKDPTPETEYNELMAEYYRRIDYAYEHFTTINSVGYESDQGQIYIRYGPPRHVERKFPPGEAVVEIWTYEGSRQFVFRATSGFGDFRLVSR